MKLKKCIAFVLGIAIAAASVPFGDLAEAHAAETKVERTELNFNTDWLYSSVDYLNGEAVGLNEEDFESVSVPHANQILEDHTAEDFEDEIASYRFVSWYRRHFTLPENYSDRNIKVEFEGVATIAEIYVNGNYISTHEGAYTTFTVDITDYVYTDGRDNVLAVRVDSERQPQIPPEGGVVDYCLFGGIVRDVTMIVTDPVYVERTFITTPDLEDLVKENKADVNVQVDVSNKLEGNKSYTVSATLKDAEGKAVASVSEKTALAAKEETTVELEMTDIKNPHLWSCDDPYLYTVVTQIKDGDTLIDEYETRMGMRYFRFGDGTNGDGNFYLNGEKVELVGINRHEQWPWIGRAVPDKLQVQDADLIKETGINLVRCSHYPQDPSFMDRCDEIGLLVFTEAPGWQHIGDDDWKETFKNNLTELILRDRNHPSIISFSATPNESGVNIAFNTECNNLVKSLDPTRPTHGVRVEFDYPYGDGKPADTVVTDILTVNYTYQNDPNHIPPHMPFIITEHSNDCWFNGYGRPTANDAGKMGFVDSFARVVDAYYANDAVAGGIGWSMFDYNNEVNYTNTQHIFYSGLYDLWRHEKPVAYFYKTQQDVEDAGAIVYISNSWTEDTSGTVYVLSNCDEIELFVNDVSKGKIKPNKYMNVPHPIFVFENVAFEAGELKAVGYVDGKAVEECIRKTPGDVIVQSKTTRNDRDAELKYTNGWTRGSAAASYQGDDTWTNAAGETMTYEFTGSYLKFISTKDAHQGIAAFSVDGGEEEMVDFYNSSRVDQVVLFETSGLDYGTHTLTMRVTGQKNSAATDSYVVVDKIEVYDEEPTADDKIAVALVAEADYSTLAADGTDMTSVMVKAVDAYGNEVPFADNVINVVQTSGVETTLIQEKNVALEGGHMAFFVQSKHGKTGTAVFEVVSEGLTSGTCTIKIEAFTDNNLVPVSSGTQDVATKLPAKYVVNDTKSGDRLYDFNYEGTGWEFGEESTAYNSDNHWTSAANDSVEIRFKGDNIKFYGTKAPAHGIAGFTLDNEEEVLVDCYSANRIGSTVLFEAKELGDGEHTLTVRNTGMKNAKATGTYINADRYVIEHDAEAIEHPDVLAEFTFDDAETGFTNGHAVAEPKGSYTLVDNKGGKALYLDGTTDYLAVTDQKGKSLLTDVSEFTVSFLAKPENGGVGWLFYAAPNTNTQGFAKEKYLGILDQGGKVLVERYMNNDGRPATPEAAVPANDWYFLTVVQTETETIVYVNGKETARQSSDYAVTDILADKSILYIGRANWGSGEFYKGSIDDYKIYSYALTAEEVAQAAEDAWKEPEPEPKLPYEDVVKTDWFYDAVAYTYEEGLMTGLDAAHFGPYGQLSRAQFALILYRMEGEPKTETEKIFHDITGDEWYGKAVLWAAKAGIVSGYTDGNFGPADNITREQMAVMMYRYAKHLGKDTTNKTSYDAYADAESVSPFAKDAMQWATAEQIISGKDSGTKLDPQGNTARCEAAAIIQRYMAAYAKCTNV